MNKYNIQVGDTVRAKGDALETGIVIGVFPDGISYNNPGPNYRPVYSNTWDRVNARIESGEDIHIKNTKMNEQKIEVGDSAYWYDKNKVHAPYEIDIVTDKGIHFKCDGGNTPIYTFENIERFKKSGDFILVKKDKSNMKVTGYKLLKDTPEHEAGAVFKLMPEDGEWHEAYFLNGSRQSEYWYYTKDVENKPEWFEPIYEPEDIKIKFSKYTAVLTKSNGLVFTDNERLSFTEVQKLVKVLDNREGKTVAGKFDVVIKQKLESVSVGCKTFTPNDVKLITEAVLKLQ